ncbi:MAG: caspase family protein [Desulfobacteraceae bacterium]|jgi:hypothetical protein
MSIIKIVMACTLVLTSVISSAAGEAKKSIDIVHNAISPKSRIYSMSHALIIGVSDYKFWEDLDSVPQEINTVQKTLSDQGFVVKKVINPNGETMHESLRRFFNTHGLDEENRLLFYFSGHGYNRPGKKKGYLVPADAPDPSTNKENLKEFIRKSINMEQIMAWSKIIEAKHVMFIFDSCFSGSIFWKKSLSQPPPDIEICLKYPVRQFITAGGENEEVPGKSIFSRIFVAGIKGDGDLNHDGFVTGTELYQYIRHEVAYQGVKQTPLEGKFSPEPIKGDFVFTLDQSSFSKIREERNLEPKKIKNVGFQNRASIAAGYTRFKNRDNVEYFLMGAGYTRRFNIGNIDLTVMTNLNSKKEYESADSRIQFGQALYLAGGYTYPVHFGSHFSFLIGIGYEQLHLDLEVDDRKDELSKKSFLLGGGIEYVYKRFFTEMKINAVWGEDENLGHDVGLNFKTGINF